MLRSSGENLTVGDLPKVFGAKDWRHFDGFKRRFRSDRSPRRPRTTMSEAVGRGLRQLSQIRVTQRGALANIGLKGGTDARALPIDASVPRY